MKSRIKIALIGFGKMGKEVNALCEDSRDFEVVSVSYKNINDKLDVEGIRLYFTGCGYKEYRASRKARREYGHRHHWVV